MLLDRFGLDLVEVPCGVPIPGSFWGDPEAGIIGGKVFLRPDTPVHSALHESCHLIVKPAHERAQLDTNASDSIDEEDATCYLQIVLADLLVDVGRERLMADMDAWGYSFRLGSARGWFEADADNARDWLVARGMLDAAGNPRFP